MSRQVGGRGNNGSDLARGAGFAAAKGAGLIGVALIIGIVLLNVVDDGDLDQPDSNAAAATTTTTAPTTESSDATTPTSDDVPARTPAELAVLVLNGGAAQGAARSMDEALNVAGYTNTLEASDWPDREQDGNVVMCKAGLDQEAAALATAVGEGTPVEAFAEPAPPGSESADCVVVVGAAAA